MEPYLRLLAAGSNARGQLANDSDDDSHTFKEYIFIRYTEGTLPPNTLGILQLATGENHTIALLEFGDDRRELWMCGTDLMGSQLVLTVGRIYVDQYALVQNLCFPRIYPLSYRCRLGDIISCFEITLWTRRDHLDGFE
ncbi:hypothetical protein BDR03DRAFT_953396 [Suillus americanus]|nr:hypothetical protein BDR03DRAFT_953396 [Suillus americanus]